MATWRPGKHKDPLPASFFYLDIGGVITGHFRECSGLSSESEVIEHKAVDEKGRNIVFKIPGIIKYENLVLKRGVTDDMAMWEWRKMVEDGKIVEARRDGSIIMYNQDNEAVARWNFYNAWPVKVSGPQLSAGSNEIAVEELTIAHEGMERVSP